MAFRLSDQNPVYWVSPTETAAGGSLTFYEQGTTTPKSVYAEKALSTDLGNVIGIDSEGRAEVDVWLSGAYTEVLKDSEGVQIWARDNVEAPSELPSQSGNGSKFLYTDGSDASWETVEQVPDYSGANDDDVLKIVSGEPFWGAPDPVPDYAGAVLEQPVLLNERTTSQAVTATATLAINYALGSVVELAQATSISTLTFSNFGAANKWARMLIIRTKDNSGTARTIAWGSVKWAGGTAPTLTSTANAIDVIELWSNGTTVLGFSRALAMA